MLGVLRDEATRGSDLFSFTQWYSVYITDGGHIVNSGGVSYDSAVKWGILRSPNLSKYWLGSWTLGGGHNTKTDRYVYLDMQENGIGTLLAKNTPLSLTYNRNFNEVTNGAYVVFHGVIDDNLLDTDTGNIELNLQTNTGSGWQNYRTINYAVQNRQLQLDGNPGHKAYGGTDICSYLIWPGKMGTMGNGQIKATVTFTSANAQNIRVDRFELMEIGA